jgi:hypothetical protein
VTTCNPVRDLTEAVEALCRALSRKRGPISVDYGVRDQGQQDFLVFVSSAIPCGTREEIIVEPFGPGYAVRNMRAVGRIVAVGITIADAMRRAARTGPSWM